jgi:myosin heavy subunit
LFSLFTQQLSELERQQWEDSKAEFEAQIGAAEEINNNLQSQLEEERHKQANLERTLRAELEEAQSQTGDTQLLAQFNDLQRRHQSLQAQLQQQQKTTDEVRRDAANFLKEMRAMSERSNATWEREEKLSRDVNRLEEEVKEWKSRYINAKTQLRHLRSSVVGISGMRSDVGSLAKENELIQPTGLVKDTHVTKFQVSIDDLLRVARSGEPPLVLDQVKVVIVAVRHVTGDVEASFPEGAELPHNEKKAKSRVSATANNLITASKNFANSSGLSPVSLLDAAASHLSIAIIELLRLVKICPTPGEQFEEDEADIAPMQSPGYFSVTHSRGLSNNESIYSAISSPSIRSRSQILSRRPQSRGGAIGISTPVVTNNKGSFGLRTHDNDLEELKVSCQFFTGPTVPFRVDLSSSPSVFPLFGIVAC